MKKIITYILESESGNSLKASGWICEEAKCGGGHWDCQSRPRSVGVVVQETLFGEVLVKKESPICSKQRWVKLLN